MRIKYARKRLFLIMWILAYVQLLGGDNRQGRQSSGTAGVRKRVEGNGNL